jgi:hypothetical protein
MGEAGRPSPLKVGSCLYFVCICSAVNFRIWMGICVIDVLVFVV